MSGIEKFDKFLVDLSDEDRENIMASVVTQLLLLKQINDARKKGLEEFTLDVNDITEEIDELTQLSLNTGFLETLYKTMTQEGSDNE